MDKKTQNWIGAHAELLRRLSEIEPPVKFGTIVIRKHEGRVVGLDTCQVTREEFGEVRAKYSEVEFGDAGGDPK